VKVLASEVFPGPAFAELPDVELLPAPLPAGLGGSRPDVEALAVVHEVVDDRTLDLLPALRLVANYGVGYDGVDVAACAARGVAVTNTPAVLDAATADLTFALVLATRRRLVEGDALLRRGIWASRGDDFLGDDVTGATIGIVGFGGTGRAVARRARAFDMRILYTKRSRLPPEEEASLGVEYRELDDLLAEADIVSLHVPLDARTEHLIDARRLALMRPGASLINAARGAVVDEQALVSALEAGRISAGLDVFADEPHVPARLLELPNVVLAPHIGSATAQTRKAMTRVLVDNILAASAGRPLPTPVAVPA
jgi:lactate dehydrogenase-like 2-hydroxyacid dehydrogenase